MIFEHQSYRSFLKDVLAERIIKNSGYSLRALARDLGIHASQLSAIYKGTKGLSLQSALSIAQRLKLGPQETEYFCLLVQAENSKSPEVKDTFLQKMRELQPKTHVVDLSVDVFKALSDWYHISILEMTELTDFELTAANAARRLGITKVEAEVALERLVRLEMLEMDEQGRYRKTLEHYCFKSDKKSQALRRYHAQMLQKAIDSLEAQRPEERYVGSQTFAIDFEQLEEAKPIIEEFRKKLVELFDRGERRSQVYHLGVQLFRVTDFHSEGEAK